MMRERKVQRQKAREAEAEALYSGVGAIQVTELSQSQKVFRGVRTLGEDGAVVEMSKEEFDLRRAGVEGEFDPAPPSLAQLEALMDEFPLEPLQAPPPAGGKAARGKKAK